MSATTRIYLVNLDGGDRPADNHLVRAANSSQALRHVTRELMTVKVASQDELVKLLGEGAKVETASAEAQEP